MENIDSDIKHDILKKYEHLGIPNEVQVKTTDNSISQKGGNSPHEPFIIKPVKVLPNKYLEY